MKKTLWLITLLLPVYAANAQYWQPFVPGMRSYYHIKNERDSTQLWYAHIDSTYVLGTDTVYLNNAQHYKNDTCLKKYSTHENPYTQVFLPTPDKIIKTHNYWKFNYAYDSWDTSNTSFYIPTELSINDSWAVATTEDTVICICESIEQFNFLSLTDSIKKIGCTGRNYKNELYLSKEHGLLQFTFPNIPTYLKHKIELAGFIKNGAGAGIKPLSIKDAYLPKSGDLLYFEEYESGTPIFDRLTGYYIDSIVSVVVLQDTLHITISRNKSSSLLRFGIHIPTFDREFYSPAYSIYNINDSLPLIFYQMGFSNKTVINKTLIGSGTVWRDFTEQGYHLDPDNCELNRIHDAGRSTKRSASLGNIYSLVCGFSNCYRTELVGLRLGNQNHGKTNVSIEEFERKPLVISPNPAFDEIKVNLSEPFTYAIYDVSGKCKQKGEAHNQINVQGLAPGMYYLHINQSYTKLIKQ